MKLTQFDRKGNSYKKYRPTYPEEVFAVLTFNQIITSESIVADIGSGTGIFTMQLQPWVQSVYAIEPNEDMRTKAESNFRTRTTIHSICATAENTTLPDQSVDCVTVAQAFHWFDRDVFKKECQRILKPNGHVVLIWNDRDKSYPVITENAAVNAAFCEAFQGFSNGMNFEDTRQFDAFFTGSYQVFHFENSIDYDLESFVGRNLSSSFAPGIDDPNYALYIAALKELFLKYEANALLKYPYTVRCYIGQV